MVKMKKTGFVLMTIALMMLFVSCEKVSPIGVLVSGTGVEDRIKMSHLYYSEHKAEVKVQRADELDEYTFLVGADSHLTTDDGRMREMLQTICYLLIWAILLIQKQNITLRSKT